MSLMASLGIDLTRIELCLAPTTEFTSLRSKRGPVESVCAGFSESLQCCGQSLWPSQQAGDSPSFRTQPQFDAINDSRSSTRSIRVSETTMHFMLALCVAFLPIAFEFLLLAINEIF